MPKIPEINFEDIMIADKYINEHNLHRCKTGLWSIYNLIKDLSNKDKDYLRLLECLYAIGVHAKYKNRDMTALVYDGKTNKKYKNGIPATKYLFALEKYGFEISNLITLRKVPKNKLAAKDISRFSITYVKSDFPDVILGLKLFSDISVYQKGDCFFYGDIRVAFENTPKMYAPPIDEIFYVLDNEHRDVFTAVHNKLIDICCERNLERAHIMKYFHPKVKGKVFATIYMDCELLYEKHIKLNLRNIDNYCDFLSECTKPIQQSIINTEHCSGCNVACGGVSFIFNEKKYYKCPKDAFRFKDVSKEAVNNYMKLIDLDVEALNR